MKIRAIIILTIAFLLGCKEKDELPEPNTEQNRIGIISDQTNLKDAEIGIIYTQNHILDQDTYLSKFGGLDVTLVKVNDTTLTFIVPTHVESGQYELITDFAVNTIQYSITKTTLTSLPSDIMSNFIGNYEENIDFTINLYSNNQAPQELLSAKKKIDKAVNDFNNLNQEDKIEAAKFIQNNSEGFNELEEVLNNIIPEGNTSSARISSTCDPECIFANAVKALGLVAAIKVGAIGGVVASVGAVALGIEIGLSYLTGKNSYLLSKFKLALIKVFKISYFAQNHLAEVTYDYANESIANFRKTNVGAYEFKNESPIYFKIKPSFRTLNIEDKDSPNSNVSTFIGLYLDFKPYWDNVFSSKYGTLATFNNDEEQLLAKDLSQFSIKITNNSLNVTVSQITGTVDDFSVTFSNKTETDQEFSFDIIFNDDGIIAKKSVSAILKGASFDFQGTWIMYWTHSDGTSSQNDRMIFDVNGYAEFKETDYLDGNGWKVTQNSLNLNYNINSNTLSLFNNYWSTNYSFNVNSKTDIVFIGKGTYGGKTIELHRQ